MASAGPCQPANEANPEVTAPPGRRESSTIPRVTAAATQGEIIRGTVETSLRNGVTITQFVGLATIATLIMDVDNGVAGIRLVDRTGATVFSADLDGSINGRTALAMRARSASDARGAVAAIDFRKAREIGLRIPFRFFESAGTVYGYAGNRVRSVAMMRPG